jgi:hypothetical protein
MVIELVQGLTMERLLYLREDFSQSLDNIRHIRAVGGLQS